MMHALDDSGIDDMQSGRVLVPLAKLRVLLRERVRCIRSRSAQDQIVFGVHGSVEREHYDQAA